ncbi:hypothetical protein A3I53_00720 [Candidatus Curtissbacteria bacterium RIFCSPLOWO2_02_FULL_40_13b]|uniref:SpoVT-AbrB domain-containing protein n=1 Tax=Candidatus Curtissbacteria bacterium RIFCSPLOWO2_02_FULL_40_13b TaxID=1797733 RepID=A0A1F5HQL5_9BACT|nr:MAG: hypothetical protein A3I53_00720 [Candidatus Curtissbacteria bacterium RIFCSPLOWO2_02_FULL_40_13b]
MKTVIIRNRGQLTIPDSIRKTVDWISPMSAVIISIAKFDEIIIRPHKYQKIADWDNLWKQIKKVRAFKGKGNLSSFIVEDREARR